jgi:pyruvate,water dikinase
MACPYGQGEDPLTQVSGPEIFWTRTNMSEAAPGVATPLTYSFFGPVLDVAIRRGFCDLGVIPSRLTAYPDDLEMRLIGAFHGRLAINVSTMRALMGGLPGLTGDDVERDIVGTVRSGVVDRRHGWRLPAVAAKAPAALVRSGRATADVLAAITQWWSTRFGPDGIIDGSPARATLAEARQHFSDALVAQGRNRMIYQAASSQLIALAERSGHGELAAALLSGAGGLEETSVAEDLQRLAAGEMETDRFIARHGYHGPNAGDLTARSWREDTRPLERLLATIRRSAATTSRLDPSRRTDAVRTVSAGLPGFRRLLARALLRLTPVAARNLERSKAAMGMALDGARAAARALGADLVRAGRLEAADDAFFLFIEELLDDDSSDFRCRVAERRRNHDHHQRIELSSASWLGNPEVRAVPGSGPAGDEVAGIGASPGVVEGRVRVVLDAGADSDVESGEVLVCPVTDPSWVGLMTVAAALVIDVGGIASHGAIVARELGVPCVIGTATGTTNLRTGDVVRVDGATGLVTVLSRATAA